MTEIGKPDIDIEDISVSGATLSEIDLLVSVAIENGNPFGIPLKNIDFEIFSHIDGKERKIAHGHHGECQISPGATRLKVPVSIKNKEIIGAFTEFLLKGGINLRISGNARIDLAITSLNVPFSEERTFSF